MKSFFAIVFILAAAAVVASLFILQINVSSQRTESYSEREPYSVNIESPLRYMLIKANGFRSGIFDVVDNQEITIKNIDTASGAFQINCQFADQRGGTLRSTTAVTLTPGEIKSATCSVDTYQADRITYSYDVIPPNKSISEIRYREVPRTRIVTDSCTMSVIEKLLGNSC